MTYASRICALALLSLSLTTTAAAASRPAAASHGRADSLASRTLADRGISLDEAVARVERKYDARAVRAEEKSKDGRTVYRIRLLSADGRVFQVTVDAQTGDVF
jgi:uncharacterized membrane protein YkoI